MLVALEDGWLRGVNVSSGKVVSRVRAHTGPATSVSIGMLCEWVGGSGCVCVCVCVLVCVCVCVCVCALVVVVVV